MAWTACDPSIAQDDYSARALTQFGDRARCATLRVPLDYANPGLGAAQVAVLRVAAGNPAARQGAILLSNGGPGFDSLTNGLTFAKWWGDACFSVG